MIEPMLAVYAADINPDDPLSALQIGERPEPERAVRLDARSPSAPRRSTTTTCGRCAGSGSRPTACP